MNANHILDIIAQAIFDKKGENILALDIKKISTLTNFIIIAEGHVDRHVKTLAQEVMEKLEKEAIVPFQIEGEKEGEWIVIDYSEVMVHLFLPQMRQKYQLERLYQAGKIVDLNINVLA